MRLLLIGNAPPTLAVLLWVALACACALLWRGVCRQAERERAQRDADRNQLDDVAHRLDDIEHYLYGDLPRNDDRG